MCNSDITVAILEKAIEQESTGKKKPKASLLSVIRGNLTRPRVAIGPANLQQAPEISREVNLVELRAELARDQGNNEVIELAPYSDSVANNRDSSVACLNPATNSVV